MDVEVSGLHIEQTTRTTDAFWMMMMYNDHLDNAVDLYSGEMKACGKPSGLAIVSSQTCMSCDPDAHS